MITARSRIPPYRIGRCVPVSCQIGYAIRLESAVSKETQLVLMTPGILLKKLGNDPMLMEYTHVLIDEVSGRSPLRGYLLLSLRMSRVRARCVVRRI